jgi:large subunit ribosomal protein L21
LRVRRANPSQDNTLTAKKPVRPRAEAGIEHGRTTMFAVVKTGGKQYRVAANDVITVERLDGEPGDIVELGEVLMLGDEAVTVGAPTVAGATVAGEVVRQERGDKVIAFKKRRRQNSRRKRGHRQAFTVLRITEILTDGRKPSPRAKAEPAGSEA